MSSLSVGDKSQNLPLFGQITSKRMPRFPRHQCSSATGASWALAWLSWNRSRLQADELTLDSLESHGQIDNEVRCQRDGDAFILNRWHQRQHLCPPVFKPLSPTSVMSRSLRIMMALSLFVGGTLFCRGIWPRRLPERLADSRASNYACRVHWNIIQMPACVRMEVCGYCGNAE